MVQRLRSPAKERFGGLDWIVRSGGNRYSDLAVGADQDSIKPERGLQKKPGPSKRGRGGGGRPIQPNSQKSRMDAERAERSSRQDTGYGGF